MMMKKEIYEAPTAEIIELGDSIQTLVLETSGSGMNATYGTDSDIDNFTSGLS